MPVVDGKEYPYTKQGKEAAKQATKKKAKNDGMADNVRTTTKNIGYQGVGLPLPLPPPQVGGKLGAKVKV